MNGKTRPESIPIKTQYVWSNIIILLVFHLLALHHVYYLVTLQVQFTTFLWVTLWTLLVNLSIGVGVHRMWSHRAFKAKLPLRIFLGFLQTMSFQETIYIWARNHRSHHKFSDTDGDPHNIQRGFFFSHVGWLFVRKHPIAIAKGKTVDLSDLEADPVVMLQKKYYPLIAPLVAFVFPTAIPVIYWNESFWISFTASTLRFAIGLNFALGINSITHRYGMRPYINNIPPADNKWYNIITLGEGHHNYHHAFPWDYASAELNPILGNLATTFIHAMEKIGQAYDLKRANNSLIERKKQNTLNIDMRYMHT